MDLFFFHITTYTSFMTHEDSREKLTAFQERFLEAYIKNGFNGRQAYLEVSSSTNKNSAGVQAAKLLKMPKFKKRLRTYVDDAIGPIEKVIKENVDFWIEIRDAKRETGLVRLRDVQDCIKECGLNFKKLEPLLKELEQFNIAENKAADRIAVSKEIGRISDMYNQPIGKNEEGPRIVDDI